MLDKMTLADFQTFVGAPIATQVGGATVPLVVEKVRDLSRGEEQPAGRRAPFSVWFLGPAQPFLDQRMYPMECGAFGTLEIFIVPIGKTPDGFRYEAIFN